MRAARAGVDTSGATPAQRGGTFLLTTPGEHSDMSEFNSPAAASTTGTILRVDGGMTSLRV
jgi:hypothetical protein